ncbi:uncharacterized protein [Choristoneura fumiferana]|uniref:uncharacterized protein n=1 Tax=Choristoneura fumiferana TaxID=7141 RepID=UPI003D15995F
MSTASRFPHQPTFKPRGRRVTYHQVDALFDYLISNQELAMSYSNSRVGRYKSQKAWETVTGMLNRIPGGARKDAKGWSAFWSNYKNKLKSRVKMVKAALNSGQTTNTKLTELDMKVLPVLGPLFACGSMPGDPVDNSMNSEDFQEPMLKASPPGSPAAPSSPDTLPSPPSPPRPAPSYTHVAASTRKTRSRPRKRVHNTNGASDGSDSDSLDVARLFSQTEDRTASALLRVADAVDALAQAAQAQAAAARATAHGMEMIAKAVADALAKRFGTTDGMVANDH